MHEQVKYLPAIRDNAHHQTWYLEIMPYIEEGAILELRHPVRAYHFWSEAMRHAQVDIYMCPTRRRPVSISAIDCDSRGGDVTFPAQGAVGDYAGVIGDKPSVGDCPWKGVDGCAEGASGTFVRQQCDRQGGIPNILFRGNCVHYLDFTKIEDGLSKTLFVGEKHVREGLLGEAEGVDCSIYNGDTIQWYGRWAGRHDPSIAIDNAHPIAAGPADPYRANFGSWHPGVCQFLVGDGSVRSLTPSTDIDVLGYLANRRDGHAVGDFE